MLTISGDDGAPGLNAPVSGTVVVPSANSGDVSFTGTFSFPAGTLSGATETIAVSTTDDFEFEGTEDVLFTFDAVNGAMGSGTFTLTIEDNDTPPFVLINEVDADQLDADMDEFVELRGPSNTSLNGFVLTVVDGDNNVYDTTVDLTGATTDANGLALICFSLSSPSCTVTVGGSIENGVEAVALYVGAASDYQSDDAVTTDGLVDAVVFSSGESRNGPFAATLNQLNQFDDDVDASIQRLYPSFGPAGRSANRGLLLPSSLFYKGPPSPGAANISDLTVRPTGSVADQPGWRLLAAPLQTESDFDPIDVDLLADINLVQGVPAGVDNEAQYPQSSDNLYVGYAGGGSGVFTVPADTDEQLRPGQGFFWYWYDNDVDPTATPDPANPGTSHSYDLDGTTGFDLVVTGITADVFNASAFYSPPAVSTDGFYMIGNPYAYPYRLGGVTISSGTLQTTFQVWDPTLGASGNYRPLTTTPSDPYADADLLPVWNGAFAETDVVAGGAPTFSFPYGYADGLVSEPIIARPTAAAGQIAFELRGDLDGTAVSDVAAIVRFDADAATGWDRADASKLMPPAATYALIAPVLERDGTPRRAAVTTLPLEPAVVPLAFTTTADGTFTLSWTSALPDGYAGTLRDVTTGQVVDLAAGSYRFTSESAAWADRFEVVVDAGFVSTGDAPEAALVVGTVSPNPTTGSASLAIQAPDTVALTVELFDALGRRVAVVADGVLGGATTLALPVDGLPSGLYTVRVATDSELLTRRFTVLR